MARMSNSTLRTVRFYEEEGILRPARRTDGGHRLFDKSELDRLMLVTDMRAAGLSLDEIKAILELKTAAGSGSQAAAQAVKVISARIEDLREKVAALIRLRDDLTQTVQIVSGCLVCDDEGHSKGGSCDKCSVITAHPSLPRSVRVLWSINSQGNERAEKPSSSANGHDEP
jgi:DNA-binding transcriptional MerR regulator